MAKDKTPLTEKQQDVFTLLTEGLTPTEAAERLSTSPTNIYGHMRKIKAKGYRLPRVTKSQSRKRPGRKPRAAAQSNGSPNGAARMDGPPEHIRKAVMAVKEAIDIEAAQAEAHEARIQELRDELEAEETQAHQTVAEMKRLENARNDLTGAAA